MVELGFVRGGWFYVFKTKNVYCFRTKTPGPGAQSALRALARSGMKIGRIGESTRLCRRVLNESWRTYTCTSSQICVLMSSFFWVHRG